MTTVIQLFDDLDDVGHSVAEADLVRMMAVVMVVVRLLMVSPDWRRAMTLSTMFTPNGNIITYNIVIMLTGFRASKRNQGYPVLHSLYIQPLLIDPHCFLFYISINIILCEYDINMFRSLSRIHEF